MRIEEIVKIGLKCGKEREPSGKYEDEFDDSGILNGEPQDEARRVAVGIDIESQELLLVSELSKRGEKIDLVIAHHPEGKTIYNLYKMIKIQEGLLINYGGNSSSAQSYISKAEGKYKKAYGSINYNRSVETAKLLGIPFINIHTPADNMVHKYLQEKFDSAGELTLKEAVDMLLKEEEYAAAEKDGAGPFIASGKESYRCGKIVVDMTGGVEADKTIYPILESAGVGTIVGMHMSEEHLKEAEKHNLNVIIAGHMASDTIGMNLLLDEIEKVEKFEAVIELSGFRRVRR